MKPYPVQNGSYNYKGFEYEGQVYAAERIPDTRSLKITNYDKSFYSVWNLKDYFSSAFQPIVIYLLFDFESKLNSFAIKLSLLEGNKLLSEITIDKNNVEKAGRVAIYSFKEFIFPQDTTVRFSSNENIDLVTLVGRLSYIGPVFEASNGDANADTYAFLPDSFVSGMGSYLPGSSVLLATEANPYDMEHQSGMVLYPFSVANYFTADSLGFLFETSGGAEIQVDAGIYRSNDAGQPYNLASSVYTVSSTVSEFVSVEAFFTFDPRVQYWMALRLTVTSPLSKIAVSDSFIYSGSAYEFNNGTQRQLTYSPQTFDRRLTVSDLTYTAMRSPQTFLSVK